MFLAPPKRRRPALWPGPYSHAHTPRATSESDASESDRSGHSGACAIAYEAAERQAIHASAARAVVSPASRALTQSSDATTAGLHRPTSPCRFCGMLLSSGSNRLRHERSRHPAEMAQLELIGKASRKRPAMEAFAQPSGDSVMGSVASQAATQVTESAGSAALSRPPPHIHPPNIAPQPAALMLSSADGDSGNPSSVERLDGTQAIAAPSPDSSGSHGSCADAPADAAAAAASDGPPQHSLELLEVAAAAIAPHVQDVPAAASADEQGVCASSNADAPAMAAAVFARPSQHSLESPQVAAAAVVGHVQDVEVKGHQGGDVRDDASQELSHDSDMELLGSAPSPAAASASNSEDSNPSPVQSSPQSSELSSSDAEEEKGAHAIASVDSIEAGPPERPLLQEEKLQRVCYPFLQWLSEPPMTQVEAIIKKIRVKSLATLQPIKSNLRFIFAMLYDCEALDEICLDELTKLSACQSLFKGMVAREVGSARLHAIFLLIKKVLVYLSSRQSTRLRQFILPSIYESYMYVESVCSDASYRRKQEARNRALGMMAGPQDIATLATFQIPTTWSAPSSAAANAPAVSTASSQRSPGASRAESSSSSRTRSPLGAAVNPNSAVPPTMTKEELKIVTAGCMSYLRHAVVSARNDSSVGSKSTESDQHFVHYLVVAVLCLGLAPRSQVLKALRIGSTFGKEAGGTVYWVNLPAELNKNGKPTRFALAKELTPIMDHYLCSVRPRILQAAAKMGHSSNHDYVFFKRSGEAPRIEFCSSTALITQKLIGRPINAHGFRAAVITMFYETPGVSEADMEVLARIMSHSPATAKNYYYKPQHSDAAMRTNERLVDELLQVNPGVSYGLAVAATHPNMDCRSLIFAA